MFAATRVALPLERARIGYLGTWTDHPFLDRDALINAVDFELTPNDWWRVSGQAIRSDIGHAGVGDIAAFGAPAQRAGYQRLRGVAADGLQPLLAADAHAEAAVHRRPLRPERSRLHGAQLAAPGRMGDQPPRRRRPRGPHQRRDPAPVHLLPRECRGPAPAVALAAVADRGLREQLECVPGAALRHQRCRRPAFARQRAGAARRPRERATSTPPRRASATGR